MVDMTSPLPRQKEIKSKAVVQHPNNSLATKSSTGANSGVDFGNVASGISSVLGGVSSIFSTASDLAKTADISEQNNTIDEIETLGNTNYGTLSDIASDYNRLSADNNKLDLSYDSIRGGSTGQRVGGVLSSAATGAMTGLSVGGPWGAAIGGVVGLGAGLAGVFTGNAAARYTQGIKEIETKNANEIAGMNLRAATDRLKDTQFRADYANRAALGGQIERQKSSMQDFATSVLSRQRASDKTHSAGFVHKHVNGGTLIRIKR